MKVTLVLEKLSAFGLGLCALVGPSACLDTGVDVASAELRVRGDTASTIAARDGWVVTLQHAKIAFGPLWLCPGNTAGELCDVARGEWLDSVVVDALDNETKVAGEMWGHEGEVRSWMYDYGLVSLLTAKEPFRSEAAKELGGNSVELRGCATKEMRTEVCFSLALPVSQSTEAERGVAVVRVSGGGQALARFGQVRRLTATFDAATWLGAVDFEALSALQTCEPGCDVLELGADSQAARAVRSALEASARPKLQWRR